MLAVSIVIGVILFDQLSKFMVVNLLPWQEGVSVIKGFVQFYYDTNDGMAFGALDNHRWVFMTRGSGSLWVVSQQTPRCP